MVLAIAMAFNLTLASTVGLALPIDSVVESHIKFGIGRSPRHQTLASIETFAIKLTVTGLQQLSQISTLLPTAVSKTGLEDSKLDYLRYHVCSKCIPETDVNGTMESGQRDRELKMKD